MGRGVRHQRGQASVETVTLVPALVVLVLVAWQAAVAGWATVEAEAAARTAARAALTGAPAGPAGLAALPDAMRTGAGIRSTSGRITVTVAVPAALPGLGWKVSASAAVVRQ